MTARVTATSVQNCLHAAIVSVIEREGFGTSGAAQETGSDASTIRRKLRRGGWDAAEISGLIAYEVQEFGHSSIAASVSAHDAGRVVGGEAVALRADLLRELQDDAAVDQAILQNLDRSTQEGRRDIRDRVAMRRIHEEQLLADLDAADARNQ